VSRGAWRWSREGEVCIVGGLKYCPSLSCPHRQRLGAPAEFLDRVSACSDCHAPLVTSEADAITGLDPVEGGPYRAARRSAVAPRSPLVPRASDTSVGLAFLLGGLGLTVLTFTLSSFSGGGYIVAWGPMLYGLYRLMRGGASSARR
jgi:hypothetical protein